MLSKRIKSLLVAGLLVLGMGFAKVNSFAAETLMSEITEIEFVEGEEQKVIELQHGYITITLTKTEEGNYLIATDWDSSVLKVVSVTTYYKDGYFYINETQFKDGEGCNTIIKGEDGIYRVNLSDMNKSGLEKIEVKFELVDSDGDGTPDFKDDTPNGDEPGEEPEEPGEEPEEPKDPNVTDPETGDASIMPIVAVAAVSVAGLFALRNKNDEE